MLSEILLYHYILMFKKNKIKRKSPEIVRKSSLLLTMQQGQAGFYMKALWSLYQAVRLAKGNKRVGGSEHCCRSAAHKIGDNLHSSSKKVQRLIVVQVI